MIKRKIISALLAVSVGSAMLSALPVNAEGFSIKGDVNADGVFDVADLAEKHNIDRSQIPILWALAKGAIPIVGITKPSYAEKLAAALTINLTTEEVEVLTAEAKKTGIRQQGSWEPQ